MTYLIRKPLIAQGVQVKVHIEEHFGGKKVSADLGPLAEWVCIQDHETGRRPPAGFGGVAGTGIPHVHTSDGLVALNTGLWLVVWNGQPHVMTDDEVAAMFDKASDNDFRPTWNQKDEWYRYQYPKTRGDAEAVRMAPKELEAGKDSLKE